MLEIDISLFITGVNNSIDIGTFYETLLNVGTFEILDPSFNANVKAAVIIDTVSAYGESDYSIKNNTSAFVKLKFYKPPVPYQPNEKYILDIQQNFINIDGEPRLTQFICSIQIPTYITMDYPKSLKIMTSPDFDPSFNYMTGSYYITPHLTAMPAYLPPPAVKTGFWGTITFTNYDGDSCPIDIVLQTIDGATYTTIYTDTINEGSPAVDFVITEQDRFLEPYTTLRFNYSAANGDWFEFSDDVEGVGEIYNSGFQQLSGYYDYFVIGENLDNGNILFPMNVND